MPDGIGALRCLAPSSGMKVPLKTLLYSLCGVIAFQCNMFAKIFRKEFKWGCAEKTFRTFGTHRKGYLALMINKVIIRPFVKEENQRQNFCETFSTRRATSMGQFSCKTISRLIIFFRSFSNFVIFTLLFKKSLIENLGI